MRGLFSLVCAAVLAALFAATPRELLAQHRCERIVSLAPSVTEVLYDVGLGDALVGRTRFCRYPAAASAVPAIGGFYDASIEAIVAAKPTHVVTLSETADIARKASEFGIAVIEVDHRSVKGIKDSYRAIGERCGIQTAAERKLQALGEREQAVQRAVAGKGEVRTLVVVGRTQQRGEVSSVYVSGSDGFYSDVLRLAGAVNVNRSPTIALPLLSPEGLNVLKPDAIVEIVNVDDDVFLGQGMELWRHLSAIPAVQTGSVFLVSDDFASIPGPRYIQLVEKVAGLLHGDIGRES